MTIGPKPASELSKYYFYFNNEVHPICTVQEEKDLGVVFDENQHFKTCINQIIHKANNVLGIINLLTAQHFVCHLPLNAYKIGKLVSM